MTKAQSLKKKDNTKALFHYDFPIDTSLLTRVTEIIQSFCIGEGLIL